MRLKSTLFFALFFATFALGCGGGEAGSGTTSEAPASQPAAAPAAPAGTAVVSGTVQFNGTAPAPIEVQLARECAALHTTAVLAQNVVVNDNGTLRHVFVYVKEGLGDQTFAPSADPAVLDQDGCMYAPHVLGMQAGQTLKILNSDPLLHNIHALPETNRPFNFGMPRQGDERDRTFRLAEVMVKIKCDVHPWMSAWVGVLDHPYHSVTGEDGSFSLEGLPAGNYVLEAWHEEFGTMTQNVTVTDGGTASVDFTFGDGASAD